MTTSRFLTTVNLIGCLLITGIVLAQWIKERGLDHQIQSLSGELTSAHEEISAGKTRAATLENDIAQLKESLEATTKARQETEAALAKLTAEKEAAAAQAGLASQANQAQTKTWEAAIAARDEKIRALNEALTATRAKLDEAVAKLKSAGAR